jgi:DNA-binding IscR family transcriptional regulator
MLRISKMTDYAIMVMVELSASRGEVLSAHALAECCHLELPTVSKGAQEPVCGLRGNWQRISVAVAKAMEGVSLAEMAQPVKPITSPLDITTLNA